ncbi:hypothetical protein [Pectobacterium cacticida]|uniref:hypothetical protein n=1 Tax=Pectobacterium cacticida TaxID=69221 RepID=UPI002FEFD081
MNKKNKKKIGICQLTGNIGPFQRSHILPKAVTKLSEKGERYIEKSLETRPIWRANSWYDYNLVTAEGEKILSEIDDLSINELRKHKLIWSGFGPKWRNPPTSYRIEEKIRSLKGVNARLLRLFFLSLLWRSASSKREEMKDIYLSQEELTCLKLMILKRDSGVPYFLPMYINQISDIGNHHNRTPIYEKISLPDPKNQKPPMELGSFRFYLEGLICHIIHSYESNIIETLEPCFLGASDNLLVITHTFEQSREFNNLKEVITSSHTQNPNFRI